MSFKFEKGKDSIITAVGEKIKAKLSKKQADLCCVFSEQILANVSLDDLSMWHVDDLYVAIINFWELLYQRKPGEQKIRIYNPDYERHGWRTTHTVMEFVLDDMPFLVDSIQMEINRMGLTTHLLIHTGGLRVQRDKNHKITKVFTFDEESNEKPDAVEATIFVEIDRQTNPEVLQELHRNLERILESNRSVVEDWQSMRTRIRDAITELKSSDKHIEKGELKESNDFLNWLEDHNFTFLGMRDYELVKEKNDYVLKPLIKTGLGVLRESKKVVVDRPLSKMTNEARDSILSKQPLALSKTSTRSTVHRPSYTDYIGIKRFNAKGDVIGECRIIGLYTSAAYNSNPKDIPFLRRKVAQIMQLSKLEPLSHSGKVLQNILVTLPRDDLFQATPEELLEIVMGIFYMQERRKIRFFGRKDVYGRFLSCLVFVPKDLFNTQLRKEMEKVLLASFSGLEINFSTRFSESVLARIHFIIRIDPNKPIEADFKDVEQKLVEVGRTWTDELKEELLDSFGEERCNQLFETYRDAFPVGYKDAFSPTNALYDIKHIETLSESSPIGMNFYRPVGESQSSLRLKVYQHEETIPLSDVLPILENLGLRVISEKPYVLKLCSGERVWVNDFGMQYASGQPLDVDSIRSQFEEAFLQIWFDRAENDGFNQLVLAAGIDWREVTMLRAYAKYFKQIRLTYSQEYIEKALLNNVTITKNIVKLFTTRLGINEIANREKKQEGLVSDINEALECVTSLDEDRILRRYLDVILATIRTNYYQLKADGSFKSYISFKLRTSTIPNVPKPYPMFEIFVYSPRFEGVHLRCGNVARGGLRWSDRPEDFRTEILGLMKAQQVKNSVIVPSGAKGGFVPKQMPANGSREDIMAEGIACYKRFIRGLLDVTDNYCNGDVVKPTDVYCYDGDDPYLVVAADKGTATFSDIANEISKDYGFWLGDGFASGGSAGYDHKKMGITARGAWESVKRHFREMGRNIQKSNFTVVGVGDMAGDVFGNGMLLSKHIKLVAAFNHMHIFIDPNPSPKESWEERKRLFELPRSTWMDYQAEFISEGGGVFERSAKSITLTPEIKKLFKIKQKKIEPNQLIKILLKAEVDLLWSGGIGTFVKSSTESHEAAGDRTNDLIRVDGCDLQCKVVGEGGNLGLTQLGRIEYAYNGGLVYTDFIDNSAGVDCSDNEVNIKILLDSIVNNGDMTEKQRNTLLENMTQEVSDLVLNDNYQQTQAISLAALQSVNNVELHSRYIDDLEQKGKLDRSLEFIPDEKTLMERKLSGRGMLRPGIAVLLCYSKILINDQILASDVPEDPYLANFLVDAFPKPLQKKYADEINEHQLRREIIATKISNIIVNEMGFAFVYRLQDETGAPTSAIVRAYIIARTIFGLPERWKEIQSLDNSVANDLQMTMMMHYIRLLRRTTRWFLRSKRTRLNIAENIELYKEGVSRLKEIIPGLLSDAEKETSNKQIKELMEQNVPEELAKEISLVRSLFIALDILDEAKQLNVTVENIAQVYLGIGDFLDLNWIRMQIIKHPCENHWESLSREALRDDIDWQHRQLASGIVQKQEGDMSFNKHLENWSDRYAELIERWHYMLSDLRASSTLNYTMFFVAIRELLDLTQTSMQTSLKTSDKK